MNNYTYPSEPNIKWAARTVPEKMRPNFSPVCAVYEGLLDNQECLEIAENALEQDPYKFKTCGAWTREMPEGSHMEFLATIYGAALMANLHYWKFVLDKEPTSWMQAYSQGEDYHIHTDGEIGHTRKLTAVALLSPESEYEGGNLVFHQPAERFTLPRTQGTVVVFPPWVWHEVTPVTSGSRFTINMGFYGPPFR